MTSNFLQFDPSGTNTLSDADYNSNTERANGIIGGDIADPQLHNKLFLQTSTIAAGIGTTLSDFGQTVADSDLTGLITSMKAVMTGYRGINSQTGTYTADLTDRQKLIRCSGTFTVNLTAAATLGATWFCWILNAGTGLITIDPNSSETIWGLTTLTLASGEGCMVLCNGTNFDVFGLQQSTVFYDAQTANTDAATITSGAWRTRVLNTTSQSRSWASLSSNQITLQAGRYEVIGLVPWNLASADTTSQDNMQARLYNTSDTATIVSSRSSRARVPSTTIVEGTNSIMTSFTLSAAKVLEVQQQVLVTCSGGRAANFSEPEIYTQLQLRRVG